MQADPSIRDAITLPDGVIAALPFVNRTPGQNILWINKEWLDNLKLSMPVTIEDLEAVLTAFKTRDPNRNGRNDEVPLSFIGPYDLKISVHAWGLIATITIFLSGKAQCSSCRCNRLSGNSALEPQDVRE